MGEFWLKRDFSLLTLVLILLWIGQTVDFLPRVWVTIGVVVIGVICEALTKLWERAKSAAYWRDAYYRQQDRIWADRDRKKKR